MRLRNTRGRFGTGLLRSGGQIAMSVAATLIATGLFTLLRPTDPPARPVSNLTSGGKYGERIAGAETVSAVAERPRLSIVDWSIGPSLPTHLVTDAVWNGPGAAWGGVAAPRVADPRPARRSLRRAAPSTALAATPMRLPDMAATAPISAAAVGSLPGGLMAGTMSAVVSLASTTRHAVQAAGGGAVRLGTAAVDRVAGLLP